MQAPIRLLALALLLSPLTLPAAEAPADPERAVQESLTRSRQLLASKKFKQAAAELEKANQLAGGKCGACLLGLVQADVASGERERAVEAARAAVALGGPPQFTAAAYNALGSVLIQPQADEARLAEAEIHLRRAVELGNGMARINLAALELRRQHPEETLALARQYLAAEPAGKATDSAHILVCHARAALGEAAPAAPTPAAEGGEPMSLDSRVEPPKVLYRQAAQGAKATSGTVVVDSIIDQEGCIVDTQVSDPGKAPELVSPVVQALRYWVFQPARFQNQPVKVKYHLVYDFKAAFDWSKVQMPGNVMDPFNNPYTRNLDAADLAGRRH